MGMLQHTGEKPADPLEVRVYTGKSGSFLLYEDDGVSPQPCASSTIEMYYDEETSTLTIGERYGKFPGMLESRTIRVVFVRPGHGVGLAEEASPDAVVKYTGAKVTMKRK